MLTVSEDSEDLAAALNSGAQGYVLKGVGSRTLAEILKQRRRRRALCFADAVGAAVVGAVERLAGQPARRTEPA